MTFKAIDSQYVIDQINRASLEVFGQPTIVKHTGQKNAWVNALVPVEIGEGVDVAQPTLYLKNINDGATALQLRIGARRVVCMNGLIIAGAGWSARIIHRDGPRLDSFLETVYHYALDAFQGIATNYGDLMADLSAVKLTPEQGLQVIGNMPEKANVKARAIYFWLNNAYRRTADQGYSAWQLYNLLNELDRRQSRMDAVAVLERESKRVEHLQLLLQPTVEQLDAAA